MFLLYINDIHQDVKSTICLFADDCVVYRAVSMDREAKPKLQQYNMYGHVLEEVKDSKYLRVTIKNHLEWDTVVWASLEETSTDAQK